jgi:TIR domain
MRAGLWRRLRRHAGFTPLCIVRTMRGVLYNEEWGLIAGLFKPSANHLKLSRDEIKGRVDSDLLAFLADIADADKPEGGTRRTVLLGIDQAEEMADLAPSEDAELNRLFENIIAAPADLDIRLVLTARDDSVDATLDRLAKAGFRHEAIRDLRLHRLPIPRFRDVILGPAAAARRAGFALGMDERLAEALAVAAGESAAELGDGLPLLAIALQRTVKKCRSPDGRITLRPESAKGFLEAAIAEAARDAMNAANADEQELRSLIIPRLATWDPRAGPTGAARRQVATALDLFEGDRAELRALADALVDQRLLTRSRVEKGAIYEVAHEALLRVAPLGDLIVALRDKFVRAEVLKFEAREWVQSGMDSERLARTGERLREANLLLQDADFGSALLSPELQIRGYLDACQVLATEEAERRRREMPAIVPSQLGNMGSAILFVSHADADKPEVKALERWLIASGFTDFFIHTHNSADGDKWREALRGSADICRVVLCLVTENWLASNECFSEFQAAWYMGKRTIPLLLLPSSSTIPEEAKTRLARVLSEDQGIDLITCVQPNGELDLEADEKVSSHLKTELRAAGASKRTGLDPEAFAIDTKLRPIPFPACPRSGTTILTPRYSIAVAVISRTYSRNYGVCA